MKGTYVVAATCAWNREIFDTSISAYPGRWVFVSDRADLTPDKLAELAPRYIFFLHWSWKVPSWMWRSYECIGFHMTDLPYGRGGTPLQNLIVRGHSTTKLTAFRVVDEMDAGPVYCKADLSLDGSAEEIYRRASLRAADMIHQIVTQCVEPVPQAGDVVSFTRRTPAESQLPRSATLDGLYDFIRMLDADTYPHAYLEYGNLRLEFRRASLDASGIAADVRITLRKADSP